MGHIKEDVLRGPKGFKDLIGQERAKAFMAGLINGAKSRDKALPSAIISGPSGCGKTTSVECLAYEMRVPFRRIIASVELSRYELCALLEGAERKSILYIDEAHSLSRGCQELLFQYLDRGTVPATGESQADGSLEIALPRFTVILSTNHPGGVLRELINRLTSIELDEYTFEEMKELVRFYTRHTSIDESAVDLLALASHSVPRHAKKMLEDLAYLSDSDSFISESDVRNLFKLKKIGPSGLSNYHCKILSFLGKLPEQTARLSVLSAKLGLDGSFIRREVEPIIINLGLLMVTPSGRKLTRKGREFLALNAI